MAEKKVEEVAYPRIVKAKNGTYEYQFKMGDTQILKIKNLLEAGEFNDGYALVAVKENDGNKVYKYLGLNGLLSKDSYYFAMPYSCGRAICQRHKNDKALFRDFDGKVNPQPFDIEKTYSYKHASQSEVDAGLDLSNKLNLYGFAAVSVNGKETIANMMGETPSEQLTKKDVVNRGVQLYNFYNGKLDLQDLDSRDMADANFVDYIKRLVVYKHNLKMIAALNNGNINDVNELLKAKSADLKFVEQCKAKVVEQ